MASAAETAAAERRGQPRVPQDTATFVHRLSDREAPILRTQLLDISEQGVGLLSMIPVAAGSRIAVQVAHGGTGHELLLCRVRHCVKSPSGQFRIGAQVLQRQPGDAVHTRIPPEWIAGS
jgi:hypothetical protein